MTIVSNLPAAADAPASRLGRILWRRRATLLGVAAGGVILAAVGYLTTPPRYAAEAVVALDARQWQGLPSQAVISALPQDNPALRTELDLIHSRLLAAKVLDRLAAAGVVIDPYADANGRSFGVRAIVRRLAAGLGFPEAPPGPPPAAAERRNDSIGLLLDAVRASNDGRSLTIFVDATAGDPATAAAIANAFAGAYIDHQADIQKTATETVRVWLGQKVDGLRQQLAASENARAQFLQHAGIVEVDGSTLQAHRVAALDQQLVALETDLIAARARLTTARALAANPNDPSFAEALASPTIQAFRIEQARLQRSITDITSAGATKSGELPRLNSQLASIDVQLRTETQRVIDSLANEVAVKERSAATLGAALAAARTDLAKASLALVEAGELDRVATANREIYDTYLTRYKQTVEQEGITPPEAQLITPAEPPATKSSPSLSFALLIGIGGGVAAGLAAALLRELMDHRIRSMAQLEEATGVRVLGAVASPPRRPKRRRVGPTAFEESVARLHAALSANPLSRTARVVAITSPAKGEGKTLLTAALARSLAAADGRVLVIDLSGNDASGAPLLAASRQIYLDAALGGEGEPAVEPDAVPGEITLISPRPGHLPLELLADDRHLGALLNAVKDRFDIVLIDTPGHSRRPIAIQAAGLSDLTLLMVNTARTPIGEAAEAARALRGAGKPALLLVTATFRRRAPSPFAADPQPTAPRGPAPADSEPGRETSSVPVVS
jgi:uncharacterized protein involved in exopolysaccharide biosynthesis/Mrp family chromosome partitioning ATPase